MDANHMIEAWRAYRAALAGIKKTAWETWLHTWEKAYRDGEKLSIVEVDGDLPVYDFLDAVAPVALDFAQF